VRGAGAGVVQSWGIILNTVRCGGTLPIQRFELPNFSFGGLGVDM
jgi:hypothetical protein